MTNDLGGWFVLGMLTAVLLLGNVWAFNGARYYPQRGRHGHR
jgi:hypothetical protein